MELPKRPTLRALALSAACLLLSLLVCDSHACPDPGPGAPNRYLQPIPGSHLIVVVWACGDRYVGRLLDPIGTPQLPPVPPSGRPPTLGPDGRPLPPQRPRPQNPNRPRPRPTFAPPPPYNPPRPPGTGGGASVFRPPGSRPPVRPPAIRPPAVRPPGIRPTPSRVISLPKPGLGLAIDVAVLGGTALAYVVDNATAPNPASVLPDPTMDPGRGAGNLPAYSLGARMGIYGAYR